MTVISTAADVQLPFLIFCFQHVEKMRKKWYECLATLMDRIQFLFFFSGEIKVGFAGSLRFLSPNGKTKNNLTLLLVMVCVIMYLYIIGASPGERIYTS